MNTRNTSNALAFGVAAALCTATVHAAIPPAEREALIALYPSLGLNTSDWPGWPTEPGTECRWRGVSCNPEETHVIEISWQGWRPNGGTIPPEIGDFPELIHLDLTRLALTGPIPPEIGRLTKLEHLDLFANRLTGPIPPEIGNLRQLVSLRLHYNELAGAIPAELCGLVQLRQLYISNNYLGGWLPADLGNLRHLETLSAQNNNLIGSIPDNISNLSDLISLNLDLNSLSGPLPASIGGLSSLEYLRLHGNKLTGPIPREIGNLSRIEFLDLEANRLTGEIPTTLTNLENAHGRVAFNALFATDPDLVRFLGRFFVWGWDRTQTLPPENIVVTSVTDHTIWLTWSAVTYDDPGGYQIFTAPAGSDSWTSATWTPDKTVITFPITGLEPGTSFEFAVASFTDPHEFNDNRVVSETSEPVMATTAELGCDAPTIVVDSDDEITLSLEQSYSTCLWSTGETSPTIAVGPERSEWFWVTVTSDGGCEETASVLVRPPREYEEQVASE